MGKIPPVVNHRFLAPGTHFFQILVLHEMNVCSEETKQPSTHLSKKQATETVECTPSTCFGNSTSTSSRLLCFTTTLGATITEGIDKRKSPKTHTTRQSPRTDANGPNKTAAQEDGQREIWKKARLPDTIGPDGRQARRSRTCVGFPWISIPLTKR